MLFQPFEIAFCGYSGSGKTTLISAIIRHLSARVSIGYYKHGCHRFDIDREGKDSWTVKEAGAITVMMSDPEKKALVTQQTDHSYHLEQHAFSGMDMLFVEGLKELPLPKLILVDRERKILDLISKASITNVAAIVVPDDPDSYSGLGIPILHRDQIHDISAFIESFLLEYSFKSRPLNGLVLAGGRSERMGCDKALIAYHSQNQLLHTAAILQQQCHEVFVSCREEQAETYRHFGIPLITDTYLGIGPLGGLLSAQRANPYAAWVIAACDLPYLERDILHNLCVERNPMRFATAFRNPDSGMLEPLLACYEPKSRHQLIERHLEGKNSLSLFLEESRIKTLIPQSNNSLQNINDPVSQKGVSRS